MDESAKEESMNERVEDLARQCMSMRFFVDTASEEFDYKKFAELIVRECFYCVEIMEKIAHASNADIPPDYDKHTYLKTLEAVTGLMKAHFGVGMSVEDKKTLIKELLGVKNETN